MDYKQLLDNEFFIRLLDCYLTINKLLSAGRGFGFCAGEALDSERVRIWIQRGFGLGFSAGADLESVLVRICIKSGCGFALSARVDFGTYSRDRERCDQCVSALFQRPVVVNADGAR